MLPWKKKGQISSLIIAQRKPDGSIKESNDHEALASAMEDFCHAEESKNYVAMAKAFKSAFQILESEPHEEASDEE